MYARSDAFDAAIVDSHRIATRADLLVGGVTVAALEVLGGSVTKDATAAVRGHMGCNLVDPDGRFTPDGATPSGLSPYGNEIKLWRGISLDSGDELLPLGVFRIANATLTDSGARQWTITGYDRARTVSRDRFTAPYVVASGTNYATAIRAVVARSLPAVTFRFVTTTFTAPQLVFDAESDPWQAAMQMADSIGCEVFFDADGACVLRAVPDPATAPVDWAYGEGDMAIMLTAERAFDDDPGYNGVIVYGETTGNATPVSAAAWDANPASSTYYLGPYGKVPRFEHSQLVTTAGQAQAAADAELRRLLGVTEQAKFTSVVHPAHEAGDIVTVARAGLGLDDVFSLETVTVPLHHGEALTATTRRRKAAV